MCTKNFALLAFFVSSIASAQLRTPQESPKLGQATTPSTSTAAGATAPNNGNSGLNLPVPISQSPTTKPFDQKVGNPANVGQQVPPMEPMDAKTMDGIQSQLSGNTGKRPTRKSQSEFALIRISAVESKMTALMVFRGIKTPVVAGSRLGKYSVRAVDVDSVCLVENSKAKKCSKTVTFSDGE